MGPREGEWAKVRRDGVAGNGRPQALPRSGFACSYPASMTRCVFCLAGAPALAQADYPLVVLDNLRESQDVVIGLSLIVGLVLFSTITALLYLREHRRWTKAEAAFSLELNNLRAKLDRAEVFLSAEPQIIVAWGGPSDEPEIEGDLSLVTDAPISRRVLGFGSWLPPEPAQQLEACVERLRSRGEGFRFAVESLGGRTLEIDGRAVSGRAVMRIRDVSGDRLETVRLRERLVRTITELDALRGHARRHCRSRLAARRRWQAHLGQRRLCPRRRGQGRGRRPVARNRASRTGDARNRRRGARQRRDLARPRRRRSPPAKGACSTSSMCR